MGVTGPHEAGGLATRALGSTGMEVTRVGLGTWAIGGPWDFGWGPQDDEDSVRAIHEAVDLGIAWLDTAGAYGLGHGEEVVGRALRELPEHRRPRVFTKCGLVWQEGATSTQRVGHPDSIRRDAEASLRRLGVETIDLLQIHWPPADGTPIEDAWDAMVQLRTAGKIRFAGVSNFDADQLERLERIGHVDTLQPPVSLLNRGALDGTVQWCERHGTGVIAYSPMQSGLLTGGWSRERFDQLAPDDFRRSNAQFTGAEFTRNLAFVDRLRALSAGLDASVAEVAIAWVLAQPGVTAAIVGARRPGQAGDWIGAAGVQIDEATLGAISAALRDTGAGTGPITP